MKPKNIVFSKSKRKGKKYKVVFTLDGIRYSLDFGSSDYQQYKDRTGLGLYSHLDHKDKERRRRYYQRHGTTNNPLSARYWANRYLW